MSDDNNPVPMSCMYLCHVEDTKPLKEIDVDLFFRIIEKIIVTLLDSTEIECEIE